MTDDPVMDPIKALADSGPFIPHRAREAFLDIARTWHASLYAVTHPADDAFVGYAIVEPSGFVTELRTQNPEDFMPSVRTIFETLDRSAITIRLPDYETAGLAAIAPIAEGMQTG